MATIHETQDRRGLLHPRLRPIYPSATMAGTALTCVVAPGDNASLHVVIDLDEPSDVVVVSPTSPCTDGYFGELLATALRARGGLGLIIDAGVRDVRNLAAMQFPVWSRTVSARGTVKETLLDVQMPLVCAGAYVSPGDAVIADEDGVVVVVRESAGRVLAAVLEREAREAEYLERLASGESGLDVFGLRERLSPRDTDGV